MRIWGLCVLAMCEHVLPHSLSFASHAEWAWLVVGDLFAPIWAMRAPESLIVMKNLRYANFR